MMTFLLCLLCLVIGGIAGFFVGVAARKKIEKVFDEAIDTMDIFKDKIKDTDIPEI